MRVLAPTLAFLLLWALQVKSEPPVPAPAARLADLAWMAGDWADDSGGNLSEEIWAPPAGDSMMGMWRYVAGGETRIFELLLITQDPTGPVLRLRHFDRNSVAREERDRPFVLPLVRHAPGEAVFEGTGTEGLLRITYRRAGPHELVGVLEKGKEPPQEFRFRRKTPALGP